MLFGSYEFLPSKDTFPTVRTELRSGPVTISQLQATDAKALYEATRESMEELLAAMRWCDRDFSMQNSIDWLKYTEAAWSRGEAYNFAILFGEPRDRVLAGSIWLSRIDRKHGTANLGYWVRTSFTGKGIATAAAGLIADFGFRELGLNRLEIVVAEGNRASTRVAGKLGANPEGVLRERLNLGGTPKNAIMFSLLARDFERKKS